MRITESRLRSLIRSVINEAGFFGMTPEIAASMSGIDPNAPVGREAVALRNQLRIERRNLSDHYRQKNTWSDMTAWEEELISIQSKIENIENQLD